MLFQDAQGQMPAIPALAMYINGFPYGLLRQHPHVTSKVIDGHMLRTLHVAFVPLPKSAHVQNHNAIPRPLLNDRLGCGAVAAHAALGYQSRLHLRGRGQRAEACVCVREWGEITRLRCGLKNARICPSSSLYTRSAFPSSIRVHVPEQSFTPTKATRLMGSFAEE